MTLLDSIDSILMLYSYTGFPERGFRIFEPVEANGASEERVGAYQESTAATQTSGSGDGDSDQRGLLAGVDPASIPQSEQNRVAEQNKKRQVEVVVQDVDEDMRNMRRNNMTVKRNMMSGLSIVLTLMSIIVAFRQECTTKTSESLLTPSLQYITNHNHGTDWR
jgi:high-affinity nickel-transport protein